MSVNTLCLTLVVLCVHSGLQRRRLIPALTLDSSSSSPSHRSSKQAITSSSSSSSSPGACWVDGPLGPPVPSNLRATTATTETFEIKVYEIDDVERLQKRRDKGGSKVRGRKEAGEVWVRRGKERQPGGRGLVFRSLSPPAERIFPLKKGFFLTVFPVQSRFSVHFSRYSL